MATVDQQKQPLLSAALEAIEADEGILAYVNSLGEEGRRHLVEVAAGSGSGASEAQRGRAVFLLGQLRWRPAFGTLRELLQDPSATVRLNAIYALGEVGGPHAVEPLLGIAKNGKLNISERAHAIRCLAVIGDRNTSEELHQLTISVDSPELGRVARSAIRRIERDLKAFSWQFLQS